MRNAEKVAVILVNYNSGDNLLMALWSLANLERSPDVYIIVDNASNDDSLRLIEQDFPFARCIRNTENVGFSQAVNQGMRYAYESSATHVWLFNPDARARSGSLTGLIDVARRFPNALISPVIFDQNGLIWFAGGSIDFWRMRAVHRQSHPSSFQKQDFLTGCALFLSRAAYENVGFFDERFFLYYEDVDYSVRARQAGFELLVAPDASVDHFEVSRLRPEKTYFLVFSGLLFFFKHAKGLKKLYFWIYVTMRRFKNRVDCLIRRKKEAAFVKQAYVHFFQSIQ